ncbi:hypothetical protein [Altererythrobacter sp. Root672]|uniref:hypothetical protein n=1 Tax=Altererythrobacter sp. Root672 TaxID=1736584 RepID=UPI0006FA48D1|nr:hypothetical protein [Altererythrobacter sp. Root672]KRA81627.1 hypothetical protein ASD76_13980 [Altererythrobacter sp. Root672]
MKTQPAFVPWITAWSGEEGPYIAPYLIEGMPLITQRSQPGKGDPLWKRKNLARSRLAALEMICGVCGQPTGLDRWQFHMGHWIGGNYSFAEAPVHEACALKALKLCPVLKTRAELPSRVPADMVFDAKLALGTPAEVKAKFGLERSGLVTDAPFVCGAVVTLPAAEVRRLCSQPRIKLDRP